MITIRETDSDGRCIELVYYSSKGAYVLSYRWGDGLWSNRYIGQSLGEVLTSLLGIRQSNPASGRGVF